MAESQGDDADAAASNDADDDQAVVKNTKISIVHRYFSNK